MSNTVSSFLTQDHRDCDDRFAALENSVASENWIEVEKVFASFFSDMQHHFDMEEKVMFPAFESKTGMTGGPTQMMRMEHQQMLQILGQMKCDIEKKDKEHFFGLSETLMMLMQQHNMKEEQMLYRMADQHLGADTSLVISQMKELERA
ncbi:MAG: hemerythrin HHE cation-binding protein [Arcobacter sp.]|nr:MAG: hemerythrin HHE cation-binding protein [Arcobacter sp.]